VAANRTAGDLTGVRSEIDRRLRTRRFPGLLGELRVGARGRATEAGRNAPRWRLLSAD